MAIVIWMTVFHYMATGCHCPHGILEFIFLRLQSSLSFGGGHDGGGGGRGLILQLGEILQL